MKIDFHVDALKKEYDELTGKIDRLMNFINSHCCDDVELHRLQLNAMILYSYFLFARIGKEEVNE